MSDYEEEYESYSYGEGGRGGEGGGGGGAFDPCFPILAEGLIFPAAVMATGAIAGAAAGGCKPLGIVVCDLIALYRRPCSCKVDILWRYLSFIRATMTFRP